MNLLSWVQQDLQSSKLFHGNGGGAKSVYDEANMKNNKNNSGGNKLDMLGNSTNNKSRKDNVFHSGNETRKIYIDNIIWDDSVDNIL